MSPRVFVLFASLSLAPGLAGAATAHSGLFGEMWDVASARSLTEAQASIDGVAPTATFRATLLDYPSGADTLPSGKSLSDFLSHDAPSLVGLDPQMTTSVLRFAGFIDIAAGEHALTVASDDGFGLWIGGARVAAHEGQRAFRTTSTVVSLAEGGRLPFELIFFEHYGNTGLRVALDGAPLGADRLSTQPAAIPLPAAGALLLAALGGLALLRRRVA